MKQIALDAALEVRKESDLRVKVGACIIRGNRIIGLGANKSGGSDRHKYQWSRHAELRCMLRAGDVGGGDIYVARVLGHSQRYGMAKPCRRCETLLRDANIKTVYYTVQGGIESMRLN